MAKAQARKYVGIPHSLLDEVDRLVGAGGRRAFLIEAIRERLARERMARAMEQTLGVLDSGDYPEWQSPESVSAWVRSMRERDAMVDPETIGRSAR